MKRLWLATVVLCLNCITTTNANAEVKRYALIIGNNQPPQANQDLPTLSYADDDAVRFYNLMRRWSARSYLLAVLDDATQVRYPELLRYVKPPTQAYLNLAVADIARNIERDRSHGDQSIFYFIFAGHGDVSQGTPFLSLLDGTISQDTLYKEVIGKISAQFSHLIIDACHASGVVGSRGGFGAEITARAVATLPDDLTSAGMLSQHPNVGVLIATTVGQETFEWSRVQSGVFSHEVLSGLSGSADVNNDGLIEYSEIQAFVAAANSSIKDRAAKPLVIAIAPTLNRHAPLAVLSRQRAIAWLEGNPLELRHFFIELENGERYLDAHLGLNQPMRLTIPANKTMFLRSGDREARIATKAGQVIKLSSLRWTQRSDRARGSTAHIFDKNLFVAPFDTAFYRGFVESAGAMSVQFDASQSGVRLYEDHDADKRKRLTRTFAGLSLSSLALSAASAGLAVKARRDQVNATAASDAITRRLRTFHALSVSTAAMAVGLGIGTWMYRKYSDPSRGEFELRLKRAVLRKKISIVTGSVSAAAATASIVSGVLSLRSKTNSVTNRAAYRSTAYATAGVGIASGVSSILLWTKDVKTPIDLAFDPYARRFSLSSSFKF